MLQKAKGFTLVELMIVVGVVAILAAIAVPTYTDSVRKSRRGQAKADMVEYAQVAERFFTANGTYVGFDATLPTRSPREAASPARYGINYAATATTFTITAAPQGAQTEDGCGTLSINHTGRKQRTGSYPFEKCW
jgi:type IV pilus assembly protein PilE